METLTKDAASNGKVEEEDRILPDPYYRIIETVPPNTYGIERVRFFTGEVNGLPEVERAKVRQLFESYAMKMVHTNASDLDMGAGSCNGLVWLRVDGMKRPYPDLGEMSGDGQS